MTWMGWVLIGVLSGHMFFLISRGGPIHFAGIPALVFCCAVLAGVAATITPILDHYDRRNNEAAYKVLRRWFWWAALGLVVAAIASRCSPLAGIGQDTALLSPERLGKLLVAQWLDRWLRPWGDGLMWGMGLSGAAALVNLGLGKLAGVNWRDPSPTSVFAWLNLLCVLAFVLCFFMMLLRSLTIGEFSQATQGREALSAQIAWMHSMLLASGAVLAFAALAFLIRICRFLGVITDPPHTDGLPS